MSEKLMRRSLLLGVCLLCLLLVPASVLARQFDVVKLEKSVVRVITNNGTGTGFVINKDGYVLTNHHVIEGASRFVVMSSYLAQPVEAEVVFFDRQIDVALLRTRGLNLPPVTLTTVTPEKSDQVFAFGFPGLADYGSWEEIEGIALDVTITDGVLSRIFDQPWAGNSTVITILQHNAQINPGNSGGPLFDLCGRVIGINTQQGVGGQGIFWASHIKEAMGLLKQKNIRFKVTSKPCKEVTPAAPPPPPAPAPKVIVPPQSRYTPWLVALSILVATAALLLALRKPRERIVEVTKRYASGITRRITGARKDTQSEGGATVRAGAGGKSQEKKAGRTGLLLSGFTSGGKPIRVEITDQQLAGLGFSLGRHPNLVDFVIADDSLSRRHLRISGGHGRYYVEDLNSSNGVLINGKPAKPFARVEIVPGDRLTLGDVEIDVSRI